MPVRKVITQERTDDGFITAITETKTLDRTFYTARVCDTEIPELLAIESSVSRPAFTSVLGLVSMDEALATIKRLLVTARAIRNQKE